MNFSAHTAITAAGRYPPSLTRTRKSAALPRLCCDRAAPPTRAFSTPGRYPPCGVSTNSHPGHFSPNFF